MDQAGDDYVREQVEDPVRVALVGDRPSELVGNAQPPLRLGQQHHSAVGCDLLSKAALPFFVQPLAGRMAAGYRRS
jgi:hypothetical protein